MRQNSNILARMGVAREGWCQDFCRIMLRKAHHSLLAPVLQVYELKRDPTFSICDHAVYSPGRLVSCIIGWVCPGRVEVCWVTGYQSGNSAWLIPIFMVVTGWNAGACCVGVGESPPDRDPHAVVEGSERIKAYRGALPRGSCKPRGSSALGRGFHAHRTNFLDKGLRVQGWHAGGVERERRTGLDRAAREHHGHVKWPMPARAYSSRDGVGKMQHIHDRIGWHGIYDVPRS